MLDNNLQYKNEEKEVERMQIMKQMWQDESGIGTVELILILVVLIGIVLIFKKQITDLVNDIFKTITSESSKV